MQPVINVEIRPMVWISTNHLIKQFDGWQTRDTLIVLQGKFLTPFNGLCPILTLYLIPTSVFKFDVGYQMSRQFCC